MQPQEENNNVPTFISSSFGDGKLSKSNELSREMSIENQSADELTQKLHNLGGNA